MTRKMNMAWKSVGLLVVMLAFCSGMKAQDAKAFYGIWQINLEKTTNYPQQTQMIINMPLAEGFMSTRATIGKDGKSSTENHPVVFDGQPHQTTGNDARTISYKLIDPNTIERTHNRDGKIAVDREEVSKDGKTLTVTQTGIVRIYDKKYSVQMVGH